MNRTGYHGFEGLTCEGSQILWNGKVITGVPEEEKDSPWQKRRAWHLWEMCRYIEQLGDDPSDLCSDSQFSSFYGEGFLNAQLEQIHQTVDPDREKVKFSTIWLGIDRHICNIHFPYPGWPSLEQIRQLPDYQVRLGGQCSEVEIALSEFAYGNGNESRWASEQEANRLFLCYNELVYRNMLPQTRRHIYQYQEQEGGPKLYMINEEIWIRPPLSAPIEESDLER